MADISLISVSKRFGPVEVIRGVSLDVGSGELVVFLGPSGSGKTTLLRMIAGLETIDAGSLTIDGVRSEILSAGQARRGDGVPELRPLSAHDRGGEHGVRAQEHPCPAAGDPGTGGRGGADAGDGGASRAPARGAFRRAAAASGDRPGDREGAEGVPLRRAAVEPRRGAPSADAGGTRRTAPAAGLDDDLRDPRPGGGHDARGSDRGAQRLPDRAGGDADGGLYPAGVAIRGGVRGIAGDELPERQPLGHG